MNKELWKKALRLHPLVLALIAQAGILLVAAFVAVMSPSPEEEAHFVAVTPGPSAQVELEHRVALAGFQEATASPMVERLRAEALVPSGLPALPAVTAPEFAPVERSDFMMHDASSLLMEGGMADLLQGLQVGGSLSSFFGIEDAGERIVILVNTSVSVVSKARNRGVSMDRIQEEILALIDGLGANALFGVVQFSQGARTFEDYLAPATAGNKEAVRGWAPANLRGNPRALVNQNHYGHEAGFERAFALDPDVIFLVTDAQLNRREGVSGSYTYPEIPYSQLLQTLRRFRDASSSSTRIHVVGFEMKPPDAENMRLLTREFGGEVREF